MKRITLQLNQPRKRQDLESALSASHRENGTLLIPLINSSCSNKENIPWLLQGQVVPVSLTFGGSVGPRWKPSDNQFQFWYQRELALTPKPSTLENWDSRLTSNTNRRLSMGWGRCAAPAAVTLLGQRACRAKLRKAWAMFSSVQSSVVSNTLSPWTAACDLLSIITPGPTQTHVH